jgi:hypothetical protein
LGFALIPTHFPNVSISVHGLKLCGRFKILNRRSGQFGGQKSLGPLEKPLEIADYVFCPHKKKLTSRTIRNSGALIVKTYRLWGWFIL